MINNQLRVIAKSSNYGTKCMKKSNNKYHGNNNSNNNFNSIYSLNYKFDSISPAGKTCGTALDLIKKYNDLAKEAHGNGDYVEAEVFRQYAEHYRKIVTEINERKNQRQAMFNNAAVPADNNSEPVPAKADMPASVAPAPVQADIEPVSPSAPVSPAPARPQTDRPRPQRRRDDQAAARQQVNAEVKADAAPAAVETPIAETPAPVKREFKVIEISHADSKSELISEAKPARAPRAPRRKTLSVAML